MGKLISSMRSAYCAGFPWKKPSFVPSKRIKRLTVSLISVDSAAGWAENQQMAAATKIAGSQESSFAAVGYSFLSFIFPFLDTLALSIS